MAVNCENGTDPISVVETEPRTRTIDRTEVFLRHNSRWADVDGVLTAQSGNTFRPAGKPGQRWRRWRPAISTRTASRSPE